MSQCARQHISSPHLDRAGITLSIICGVHCLLFPLLWLAIPLSHEWMAHDQTHYWVFGLAVPIALVSLLRSFFKYKVIMPLILGLIGISVLTLSLLSLRNVHHFDFIISLTGSGFLLAAHVLNIRSCRQAQ